MRTPRGQLGRLWDGFEGGKREFSEPLSVRLLAKETERRARALGLSRLFLLTDTAERFFAAAGYQRIERATVPTCVTRTAQFASLCPASAACMRKELETAEGPSPL